METVIEQLSELVRQGQFDRHYGSVSTFTLQQELNFIERRQQEHYFLAMHNYVKALRDNNTLIGPGRRWMAASHVCYTLGITNICFGDVFENIAPVDFWGNDDSDTTMDVEVNETTCGIAFGKAAEVFGYHNVAQTALPPELQQSEDITHFGHTDKLQGFSIVVCPDGVSNHFEVEEVADAGGNKMLRINTPVGRTDNIGVFKFNIICSETLSRIHNIFDTMTFVTGKDCPKMYEREDGGNIIYFRSDWRSLFNETDRELPFFGDNYFREATTMLYGEDDYPHHDMITLLTIPALYYLGELSAIHSDNKSDYIKKHGVVKLFERKRFPFGFLYREQVCWFLTEKIGLSWKQAAQVVRLINTKKQPETENLKHFYLHHGTDNGFKEEELNHIWNSLFKRERRRPLPSMAHFAGLMYQYAFLAMLKKDYPKEYALSKTARVY